MGRILLRRPCWFCMEAFEGTESQTGCKYCKGKGYLQRWLPQDVGELLLRVDPEWYKVIERRNCESIIDGGV
jgi:hypothetical protein